MRGYLIVGGLAYRREMALRWKPIEGGVQRDTMEYEERWLEELGREERTEVGLGGPPRTWYRNLTDRVQDRRRRLKQPDLLKGGPPTSAVAA